MALDNIVLETASEAEVVEAAKLFTSSRKLNDAGYQLFLGKKFGTNKNYYWLKTSQAGQLEFNFSAVASSHFVVDFANNLVHGLGSKAVTFSTFLNLYGTPIENGKGRQNLFNAIRESVKEANCLLEENLCMYGQGKISLDEEVLGHANAEIKGDIEEARKLAYRLSIHHVLSPEFREIAAEFVKFYKEVILAKYGALNQGSR